MVLDRCAPWWGVSIAGWAKGLAWGWWRIRWFRSGSRVTTVLWPQDGPGGTEREVRELGVGGLSTGPDGHRGGIHRQRWTKVHRACRGLGLGGVLGQ